MRVGIMQPYFMPYIGYWQRIHAVDVHVVFDDVNYIRRGWMHRNRILINGSIHYLNLPIQKASQNKKINDTWIAADKEVQNKMLKTLEFSYRKAPFYSDAMNVLEDIITQDEKNLALYLMYQLKKICSYFGIKTKLVMSSDIEKDSGLKGQDKIMDICKNIDKNISGGGKITYINASSGEHLYSRNDFAKQNLNLLFIKDKSSVHYGQQAGSFIPALSVIDIMMNCSLAQIHTLLNDYVLY